MLRVRVGFTVADAQQRVPTIEFFDSFMRIVLRRKRLSLTHSATPIGGRRIGLDVLSQNQSCTYKQTKH